MGLARRYPRAAEKQKRTPSFALQSWKRSSERGPLQHSLPCVSEGALVPSRDPQLNQAPGRLTSDSWRR